MIQVDNSIIARPRPTGQPVAAGPKPTVVENLKATNRAMLAQIRVDVMEFTSHPLQSLKAMATGLAFPLAHPVIMAKSLAKDIEEDPLEGTIAAAGVATGVAFVGTVLAIGAGILAAPFTGGASLALAATAASLTTPVALACLAVDGAGIVMHEARGALADSTEEAEEQGEAMAGYVEDAALNVASWIVGDAVQAKFFKQGGEGLSLGQSVGDVANNSIGLAGIYDVPTAGASVPTPKPVPSAGSFTSQPVRPANSRSDRFELSPLARQALGLN